MSPSQNQVVHKCPHCGTVLYGAYVRKCYNCGKAVDIAEVTQEIRQKQEHDKIVKLTKSLRFRIKYRSVYRKCKANAVTFFTIDILGMRSPIPQFGGSVYNHEFTGVYTGEEAWFRFSQSILHNRPVACLKCSLCGNLYLVETPLVIDSAFGCDWFDIIKKPETVGNYEATLICRQCGHESSPKLKFY